MFTGKGTVANDNGVGVGVGAEVILRLGRSIANDINAKCFFDNWLTSLGLLIKLKEVGIWSTGTIMKNRLRNCDMKSDKDLKKDGRESCCQYRSD